MEKYILINSNLPYQGGFSSDESILRITNYSITENFPLVTGTTIPVHHNNTTPGKRIDINYQIFKSLDDFNDGQNAVHPINFQFQLSKVYNNEDVFNLVVADLTTKNLNAIVMTGGTA